ncbi:squalene/phytoene synthase family protein [Halorussus salilacus]|uniref:phytoene/squalene synthase family protein n=1 Tax=Halorussus salilacus TaxID=2953750 RepID=UPI00209D6DF1|nr:phytoene/squalene synthase family protein [Halorussus salilacus]USZ68263.1 squalene/phytoene synthase family protein [Halorussus salilacus]
MDTEPPSERTADAEMDWCFRAVRGVSRTFAITIDVLEEPMKSAICVGYLLCRVPDTVEDAGHIPADEQVRLLELYDRVLDPDDPTTIETFLEEVEPWLPAPEERDDDWRVVAEADRVFRAFDAQPTDVREAVRGPVRELVSGMGLFVERYADEGGLRIQTIDELEEYCHYVAGTVGELITNLATRNGVEGVGERRLYECAESFGRLLQLVNIAKDVRDDYREENNVYLPATWLRSEGVSPEKVTAPENEAGVAAVVRRTADRARSYLGDSQTYLESVPLEGGNTLSAWAIPYLLAVGTLREVRDRPRDAVRDASIKVSREEVHAVIGALAGDSDRETVGDVRETIAREPYHRA